MWVKVRKNKLPSVSMDTKPSADGSQAQHLSLPAARRQLSSLKTIPAPCLGVTAHTAPALTGVRVTLALEHLQEDRCL